MNPKQKQPKCPPADDWARRRWPRHTAEHYSATNRSDILIQAATWVNPSMMQNERRRSQKAIDVQRHLYEMSELANPQRPHRSGCQGLGGQGGDCWWGRVCPGRIERFLWEELNGSSDHVTVNIY